MKIRKAAYVITIFLPLILSVAWLILLTSQTTPSGVLLSPSRTRPIVSALVIFIIGYLIFMFLIFYENISEILNSFWKRFHHKV